MIAAVALAVALPCAAQEPTPPSTLPASVYAPTVEVADDARRDVSLQAALAEVTPFEYDGNTNTAPQALPDNVAELLSQSDELTAQGRIFEAGQLLRQALRIVPDSAQVNRAFGFALANHGHRARGRRYLLAAFAQDPGDIDVGLALAGMALDQREWDQAISLCASIAPLLDENADTQTQVILRYIQAVALEQTGYHAAAAEALGQAVEMASLPSDEPGDEGGLLAPSPDAMRMLLGDLYGRLGQPEQAGEAYASADIEEVDDPGGLIARRVWVKVQHAQIDSAVTEVAAFLASPLSRPEDADLVRYLLASGAASEGLADALEAHAVAGPPSLALIVGLRDFVSPVRTAELLDQWLTSRPLNMTRFSAAVDVLRRNGPQRDSPAALSQAVLFVAQAVSVRPQHSEELLLTLIDPSVDPAALIRALKQPEVAEADQPIVHRVAGRLYRAVGRIGDAEEALCAALSLDDRDEVARLMLAEVYLETQQPARVAALFGELGVDTPWRVFELSVAAISQNSQLGTALALVTQRLEHYPDDLRLRILHARILAASGLTVESLESLGKIAEEHPGDERAYAAGLAVIYATRESADGRIIDPRGPWADAHNALMRGLATYLPESETYRRYLVEQWFRAAQFERAIPVLRLMLGDDPDSVFALSRLTLLLELSGPVEEAEALRAHLAAILPPGAERQARIAEHLLERGQAEEAAALIYKALAEDEEGVMPGPAMTDRAASGLLNVLTLAEGLDASEPYYLSMIRRFPESVLLNNGLGYRWAVAGKELASARVMIRRAIDVGGENDAVLDSMAWVLYRMGELDLARANMQQAITLQRRRNESDSSSRSLYADHMGDILYALGDIDSARTQWTNALMIASFSVKADVLDDDEIATLEERLEAKLQAVVNSEAAPVTPVLGEAALGRGGHPADWE